MQFWPSFLLGVAYSQPALSLLGPSPIFSAIMITEIDLKALGIDTEPKWWESLLKTGMVIAAVFQAVCIAYAVFGPDKSKEEQNKTSPARGNRKGSHSPTESLHSSNRKKAKQEKKKR